MLCPTAAPEHVAVELGNCAISATIRPGAEPPVVFVSGMDEPGDAWAAVLPLLATRPTTVTYDRPGIGASQRRPDRRPLPYSGFAEELAAILDHLDLTHPVVLVGHSFGSLIVRMFAARHPERVAGMVHVDGSIPELHLWKGSSSAVDGGTAIDPVAGETEIRTATLPQVPAVVLCRTPGRWDVTLPDPAIDDLWQHAQLALAIDLGAPLVMAANAGHRLAQEDPILVASAIDDVVHAVRTRLTGRA